MNDSLVTTLVEALAATVGKLHVEGQLRDPDGYSWAEQEQAEDALALWLEMLRPEGYLADRVRHLLAMCEGVRR